ncbi:hypothetical protein JG687_00013628, partial [Phytophthora cactorum]
EAAVCTRFGRAWFWKVQAKRNFCARAKISIQTRFGRTRSMGKWMTIDNKRNLIQQSYIK